jgi:hypothetical protein
VARISGRRGRVYIGIASGSAASPLPFQAAWSISFATDKSEVTSFDDVNKTYIAGLPDASGDFSGFYDDATAQTYTAATDGVARNFYLYPSLLNTSQYWFGTVLPDFKVDGDVGDAIKVSASWSAASPTVKVG